MPKGVVIESEALSGVLVARLDCGSESRLILDAACSQAPWPWTADSIALARTSRVGDVIEWEVDAFGFLVGFAVELLVEGLASQKA